MNSRPPAPQSSWAWFLDIDGTLAKIAPSPESVRIDAEMQRIVAQLYHATNGALAIVSGRALRDVDKLFPALVLPAAGQHGVEHRNASGVVVHPAASSVGLDCVREELREMQRRYPGLRLEDKGFSLAMHYRAVPQLAGTVHRCMQSLLEEFGHGFVLQPGKCVMEFLPVGNSKGLAVREFMQEEPFHGRVPVFIGDDVTDESAFAAVLELKGYAIKVGPGSTVAPFRLKDVAAVRNWLAVTLDMPTPDTSNSDTAQELSNAKGAQ